MPYTKKFKIMVTGYMRVPIETTVSVDADIPQLSEWRNDNPGGDIEDYRDEVAEAVLDEFDSDKNDILEQAYWQKSKNGETEGELWWTAPPEFDDTEAELELVWW